MSESTVSCVSALRLLRSLPDSSASAVVIDPPSRLGIGESEDESPIVETMAALTDVATEVARVLHPGGASIVIGDAHITAAWELAAGWSGLWLAAELVVLWDASEQRRSRNALIGSLTTEVRWHLRPGSRSSRPPLQVRLDSNVVMCKHVPMSDRRNAMQRPVELFNYLITILTEPRDLVIDPYCGSGSVLVAAEMCNRRWIGGDIDPQQVEIARRRTASIENEEMKLQPLYLWTAKRLIEIEG